MMSTGGPHFRRVAFGLLAALVLVLGVQQMLLGGALRGAERRLAERRAVLDLAALAEIVGRAGGTGDLLRTAVTDFAGAREEIVSARVVALSGAQLEASTDPLDAGENAAPRRLRNPDEKFLFDQGQRIRAAIETNRDEGASRKGEIELERADGGGLVLAAPYEVGGAVAGIVRVQTRPAATTASAPIGVLLVWILASGAAFGLLSRFAGRYRAALGALIVVAAVLSYGSWAGRRVAEAEEGFAKGLAASAAATASAASAALTGAGFDFEPPLTASRWDLDVYRHPRGLLLESGAIEASRVQAAAGSSAAAAFRSAVMLGVVALGLYLLAALGVLARFWAGFRRHRHAYAYAAPAMIGMILLVFFPFLYGVILAFTDATIYNSNQPVTEIWVGLRNFVDILGNFEVSKQTAAGTVIDYQNFYWTLGFTIVWTVSNVTVGVTVGLFLALILNTKRLALRPIYRVLLILPWAMPNYITALIWRGMFHQQFGVANQLIQIFGGEPIAWFENVGTSFLTVLATNGWLSFPFMMVISLGALQSIPAELYEAARVDGATRWQQFRAITLPSLKPALVPAVILSVIWTFNMFNVIYLVTGGEPAHGTELLITQAFKFAFEQYRYGYAAAYSCVIFLILLTYGLWQNRVTRATEGI